MVERPGEEGEHVDNWELSSGNVRDVMNGGSCVLEQIKAEHPTKWELVQNDQLLVRVAASDLRLLLATACGGGRGGGSNPPSPDEPANPARTPFAAAVATSAIVEAAVPAALAKTIARSRHLLLLSSIEARHCARSCLSQLSVTPRASIETTHAAVRPFHLQNWIRQAKVPSNHQSRQILVASLVLSWFHTYSFRPTTIVILM